MPWNRHLSAAFSSAKTDILDAHPKNPTYIPPFRNQCPGSLRFLIALPLTFLLPSDEVNFVLYPSALPIVIEPLQAKFSIECALPAGEYRSCNQSLRVK